MRRETISYAVVTRILLMASILLFWNLPSTHADVISLADIVGGGDGSGNGTDSGIDLETGLQTIHPISIFRNSSPQTTM